MTAEELRELADELDEFTAWARGSVAYVYVYTEQEFYVDAGELGEQTFYRDVEIADFEFEASRVVEQAPRSIAELESIAEKLRVLADELGTPVPAAEALPPSSLADALAEMAKIAAHAQTFLTPAVDPDALPTSPLPWPGALNPDIDYTAEDFPLRYQPPPGFDWAKDGTKTGMDRVSFMSVRHVHVDNVEDTQMILDKFGRVSWKNRADEDLDDGYRWPVWHMERDGIPKARSYAGTTPPRSISASGNVLREPHTATVDAGNARYNWETIGQYNAAIARVHELREATPVEQVAEVPTPAGGEEFEAPGPVEVS